MACMRVVDATVQILTKEGVMVAFGIPGAVVNDLYSALKADGRIGYTPARHGET